METFSKQHKRERQFLGASPQKSEGVTGFRNGCLEGLTHVLRVLSVSVVLLSFLSSRLSPAAAGWHGLVSEAALPVSKKHIFP